MRLSLLCCGVAPRTPVGRSVRTDFLSLTLVQTSPALMPRETRFPRSQQEQHQQTDDLKRIPEGTHGLWLQGCSDLHAAPRRCSSIHERVLCVRCGCQYLREE